ncbi:hypothetical protein [Oceanobacillus picturae]|uniref:hypothetical protein n=1 Tax=Oceanobacillus picturae TaxID=171693 RepID=UPI00362EB346
MVEIKNGLTSVLLIVVITIILGACGSEEDTKPNEDEQNLNETIEGEQKDNEEGEDNGTSSTDDEEDTDRSVGFETSTEDQLDLKIGDKGKFDTDLTTFEITLNSAEIIDEVDDISSQLDSFIILDITLKNTGEETYTAQDLLYGLEVTAYLDSTGYQDYSEDFESVKGLEGDVSPGEELSGEFITEIPNAEEYFFHLRSGITGTGASNEVVWTIPAEEAK